MAYDFVRRKSSEQCVYYIEINYLLFLQACNYSEYIIIYIIHTYIYCTIFRSRFTYYANDFQVLYVTNIKKDPKDRYKSIFER